MSAVRLDPDRYALTIESIRTEAGLDKHYKCAAILEDPAPELLRMMIAEIRSLRRLVSEAIPWVGSQTWQENADLHGIEKVK